MSDTELNLECAIKMCCVSDIKNCIISDIYKTCMC